MNKLFNFGAMLTIAAGAMMVNSSCSNNDMPTFDPGAEKTAAYQNDFVKTFGNIDPNNDWGFGENIPSNPKETRANSANNNEWGKYVEVPDVLTDKQIEAVTEWFTKHQNPQGIAVNWSDFFVQQVSSTEYGKKMNYLTCGNNNEHIANFNGGDCGAKDKVCYGVKDGTEDINNRILYRYNDKINFMVNSSTECFGYYESRGNDNFQYNDLYVIIPGDVIAQEYPNLGLEGMYFVGFDYKFEKADETPIHADGYYNDWIVKITPGLYTGDQRVMCEDLGATADYDFNDIVFDVKNDRSGYPGGNDWDAATIIIVRAAGGTLPATIAGKEIHELFGVSTSDMVNTGIKSAPVAIFRIPQVANAKDIEVKVGDDSGTWELKTATGAAPQKICVPSSVKWNKEYKSLKLSYPDFENYVGDANAYPEWYKNVAASNELY